VPIEERIVRSNYDALSEHTATAAFKTVANCMLSSQEIQSVFNGTFAISFALVPLAMLDNVIDTGPYETLMVASRLQVEISDDFTDNTTAMPLVGAFGVRCS
jgi:hypothetical protein